MVTAIEILVIVTFVIGVIRLKTAESNISIWAYDPYERRGHHLAKHSHEQVKIQSQLYQMESVLNSNAHQARKAMIRECLLALQEDNDEPNR